MRPRKDFVRYVFENEVRPRKDIVRYVFENGVRPHKDIVRYVFENEGWSHKFEFYITLSGKKKPGKSEKGKNFTR